MARPTTISNDQILEAAREVFTERGLAATTAEIAELAGCSEGSIFRRFATKHDLFLAAMGIRDPNDALGDLSALVGHGNIEQNLRLILERKIDFYLDLLPRMMVLLGCGMALPELMREMDAPPPLRSIRAIADYLVAERDAGRITTSCPEVVARTLIGAAHFYAFTEHTGINDLQPMTRDAFVSGFANHLLSGILPDPR